MIRFTPAALAVLALAAAPVLAQTTRPQTPVQRTTPQPITPPAAPATSPAPGSEEWLRLRGETYRAAPEAEQDPAEVAETSRLNAAIVARNNAAERRENEAIAAWQAENTRWRAEVARLDLQLRAARVLRGGEEDAAAGKGEDLVGNERLPRRSQGAA
jgi:hypothetical protein